MRLLEPKEVDALKARDKAREIAEGVKLAKQVDNLREVKAQEEASLAKFRSESLAKIHEQIKQESDKRDALKREVYDLEERKKEAQKPLDAEKEAIAKERAEVESFRAEIQAQERALEDTRKGIADKSRLVELEKRRTDTERGQVREELERAQTARILAEKDGKAAKDALAESQRIKEEMLEDLKERDIHMAVRERDVKLKEENLSIRQAELDKEWKLLRDRQALLERTLKRNK